MKYTYCMGYTNDYSSFLRAVNSIKPFWSDLTVVDNSLCKDAINFCMDNYINIRITPVQLSCSQMFNLMQQIARNRDSKILVSMHSDIEVKDGFHKKFIDFIESINDNNWGVILTMHDSLAAWNMDVVNILGEWDTTIDQYPTDADYLTKLDNYGFTRIVHPDALEVSHYPSSTVHKNLLMSYKNQIFTVNKNEKYFHLKWDGFKIPFNGRDMDFVFSKLTENPIYHELLNSYKTEEGAFLQGTDRETRIAQFNFIINLIKSIKPTVILETGTHKSLFAYFLTSILDKFTLYTFDENPNSVIGVNILSKNYPNINIKFNLGNTIQTLPNFFKYNLDLKIDIAYVDGGHNFDPAYSDLKCVTDAGIKNIIVDDFAVSSVKDAVNKVLSENYSYYYIENPLNYMDCRKMILITKR